MIDKIDYWFLELVVQIPLSFLTIIPYDQRLIKDYHDTQTPYNLTTNQIIDILLRLFQEGYLLAINPANFDLLDTHLINGLLTKAFIPSHKQLETALDRTTFHEIESYDNEFDSEDLYFFLTKKGGEIWESWSKPKWNQYFRKDFFQWESVSQKFWNNSIPPHGRLICCADQEVAKKIIANEHLFYRSSILPYAIKNSEIWETLTPWYPTYWKTLPQGYVVSYQVELVEIDENYYETEELTKDKRQAREWYNKIVNWYTKDFNNL